jgi:zinc-binding alcohol dehydrogenase family protein
MKAISFHQHLPIEHPDSLIDVIVDKPKPGPRDLLVQIQAISVNPVDTKIRKGSGPGQPSGELKILGWDAAGIVTEVGSEVTLFAPGNEVYFAGSVDRPGSYAEFTVVDERIVGRKPSSIDFANTAALPLTTITAWEMLFDRLSLRRQRNFSEGSILIIGGAGGVGSIATQLAGKLTGLTVIASASRPETVDWCREMGAHHVIDHRQPLAAQVKKIVPEGVNYVLALTKTEDHFDEIIEAMAPEGAMVLIENMPQPIDVNKLKPKCLSFHWEFMFCRPRFQTSNMKEQGRLLNEVAGLIDAGLIRSTARTNLGLINAANMKHAHALVESGKTIGKIVLSGFSVSDK